MKHVVGLKIELSLERLYEGGPDGIDLAVSLRDQGFVLWAIEPGFVDPRSGRMLQVDGVFYRARHE
jgi:hypothetical protein